MDSEQVQFVRQIAQRLDKAGIPYMVTGSVALSFYAQPRMTRDVDVVVACEPGDAPTITRLFEEECYVDEEVVRSAIRNRSMFNIIHNAWIQKADFIVRKDEEYRKLEFERRRRADLKGVSVSIVAPEDLLLSKLRWARDSESELQLGDARAIATSGTELDRAYLEKWAEKLGLSDLLERASDR
ncbi:MAG: hypothetical protein R6V58_03435 [Planctomycetota bacterium]